MLSLVLRKELVESRVSWPMWLALVALCVCVVLLRPRQQGQWKDTSSESQAPAVPDRTYGAPGHRGERIDPECPSQQSRGTGHANIGCEATPCGTPGHTSAGNVLDATLQGLPRETPSPLQPRHRCLSHSRGHCSCSRSCRSMRRSGMGLSC